MEIDSTKLEEFAELTNNDIYDSNHGWMFPEILTRDSLEDFIEASSFWSERSRTHQGRFNDVLYLSWENVQGRKGDMRDSLTVLDFGDVRVSLKGLALHTLKF